MGKHLESMKVFITGKDNLAHNGTIVTVELYLFFCAEIVEAICFWFAKVRNERALANSNKKSFILWLVFIMYAKFCKVEQKKAQSRSQKS